MKKRANLLLKGHSNDLSASYGSNHPSVFKKANDKLAGDVEISFSYDRRLAASLNNSFQKKIQIQKEKDDKIKENKLKFRVPLAENTIIRMAELNKRSRNGTTSPIGGSKI